MTVNKPKKAHPWKGAKTSVFGKTMKSYQITCVATVVERRTYSVKAHTLDGAKRLCLEMRGADGAPLEPMTVESETIGIEFLEDKQ